MERNKAGLDLSLELLHKPMLTQCFLQKKELCIWEPDTLISEHEVLGVCHPHHLRSHSVQAVNLFQPTR